MANIYPSEKAMFEALHAAKRFAREPYAWPGGYPLILVMSDGGTLCGTCAREEWKQIAWATINGDHGGWTVVGVDAHYEGPPEVCDHCGDEIESAYGADVGPKWDRSDHCGDEDCCGALSDRDEED